LPDTPMVHTPSGGLHVYFDRGNTEIRNSVGKLGPGLDVRGDVGYVIVPSEGSGYWWDPHCSLAVSLVPVPTWLIPTEQRGTMSARPVGPTTGLSPYAEAALNSACRNILGAPAGQQEATLNGECFAIGALAGAGGIPTDFARRVLIWAAERLPSYDAQRPWRSREIEQKVSRAFNDGMRRPRGACRAA
jgi:hypothetical protein